MSSLFLCFVGGGMMNKSAVVFKGDADGLIIVLDEKADFADIKIALQQKFSEANDFFQSDMVVRVNVGKRELDNDQKRELINIFRNLSGLSVVEFIKKEYEFSKRDIKDDTLLVKGTIRSGQSIDFEGNIVILGDVNPGAEVVAKGDIIVMGNFRGIGHAGIQGKEDSIISAFRLEPTQLRIANYISRSPDMPESSPEVPEIASIKDDNIVIEHLKK